MNPTDKLLTPADVAAQLQVNVRTVYEYINTDQLPAIRLGHRTIRVKQSDVDNLIDSSAGANECN